MNLITSPVATTGMAVQRYEEIQSRLPSATFPQTSVHAAHLEAIADEFDCFVLDGFGVLNVGETPVPGAVERLVNLRSMGKQLRVLTNGATMPVTNTLAKYRRWGMHFEEHEVVSSRDALARGLQPLHEHCWGFVAIEESQLETLAPNAVLLQDDEAAYDSCTGFVLLGTRDWTKERQELLRQALAKKPRPVLVGNPDLVAPWLEKLSLEPGLFAHDLQDAGVARPEFFGKPFDNAFAIVRETVDGIEPQRIAMVGDTLHTDILGGAQAGWRTVLISGHGLLRDQDVEAAITRSGIRPDFIVPTT